MSATRRPYFVITGLPVDDETLQDLDVEQLFHMNPEEVRGQLEASKKSLKDNGFDFDLALVSPSRGYKLVLDKLDQAEHVDGVIFGYGIRGHPSPSIAIFMEELIDKVRYHPKNVRILFNWSITSSLDACQRAMKLEAEREKETVKSA
ncbi:hypothetical protein SLS64_012349 [Diaporthe eres]|uniref:Uncharacterized protein n=1 Tax=Diaporthe eres TaxID=83184 RepID=A0ABR1P0P7_DIAER